MLPRQHRLTLRGSFSYLYRKGKCVAVDKLLMYHLANRGTRVGFSVSNRIGKAVVRNLLKRRMRAAMRELLPLMSGNAQIVWVARKALSECSFDQLVAQMRTLLERAQLLPKTNS